ncbi:MAG: hypothetical protein ABIR70_14940 [Bryobacteraceae bacterium]
MNSLLLWLTDLLSRTLDPDERSAVRGDCDESAQTALQTLHDVFGLVVRRQAGLWMNWRPWLALAGVAAPTALLLIAGGSWLANGYALQLWVFRNYADIELNYLRESHSTVLDGLLFLSSRSFLLAGWSWSSGHVIGKVAGRARGVIGILFSVYLVMSGISRSAAPYNYDVNGGFFSSAFYARVLPFVLQVLLILIPALWGMRQASRSDQSPAVRNLLWVASVTTAFAVPALFWWPAPANLHSWEWLLAGCWYMPLVYVLATANWTRWRPQST